MRTAFVLLLLLFNDVDVDVDVDADGVVDVRYAMLVVFDYTVPLF